MTTRTHTHTVTFTHPFTIGGLDEVLAAGEYRIATDEELVEGLSFPVYRRILTLIELPPTFQHPNRRQLLEISPDDLEIALARDKACLVKDMEEGNVELGESLDQPWQDSAPQPSSGPVARAPNSVEDEKQQTAPERSIFGMAAELINLIRRDRMDRAKYKDRS